MPKRPSPLNPEVCALTLGTSQPTAELEGTWQELAQVVEGSNDGFWLWTVPAGRIAYSRRWVEIIGRRIEELQGTVPEWQEWLHPDERSRVISLAEQTLCGQLQQFDTEHRLRHSNGQWVWVRTRARVVARDERGRPKTVAGSCTDVTAVKLAEQRLRQTLLENERLIVELSTAMHTVSSLSELLPVCAWCRQFRDESGRWHNLEQYVAQHAKACITHGICPDCSAKHALVGPEGSD